MKIDKEYILKFLRHNKNFLRKEFGVTEISLFGSFARGEETEDSDIDLFVDMPPDLHKLLSLIEFLENNLKRKIDIVRNREYLKQRLVRRIQEEKISA
ncbi:MAG: nucleotidyltransferase domain-containing protein [Ignavibacterium album]|jgi:predicted nucleotidyltransferase|uniref:Nucleotidyltransferase n=1 Tax=Ignavibacterium album TaxID=591197 RepID=A0A7V2ZMH6_9BACT|nr:nucleotidyltransferase domain-containing protein [Ignavibacterium album]MCX8106624.1 nucleotidyltransferase domain-containing protein [Ignavibacterium album]